MLIKLSMKYIGFIYVALLGLSVNVKSQLITINYQAPVQPVPALYQPGIFLVPKTLNGGNDFLNNNIHYNSIRTIDLEEAINHWTVSSIADVMVQLEALKPNMLIANSRCDKLILPILKMPQWLSSSSDASPVAPGFLFYNAVPPSNYTTWNTLMDSIVDKINNQWGLDPYYEFWNEPDGDYWQGTEVEYFQLFKSTIQAIKSNHPTAKVGGPTVSNFRIKFGAPFTGGYLTPSQLDETIIGRSIDSCVAWGTPLDFVSWHKFEVTLHAIEMELDYLNQKLVSSGHGAVPYLVSEWNLAFNYRETDLDGAFMINYSEALNQHNISGQMVAAWQDFEEDLTEFHGGYGLLSWGALHKPSWKALLLLNKLQGVQLDVATSDYRNLTVLSSYQNDTVKVLISNYSLPGFVEASLNLYFEHDINESDLAASGINPAKLDSIYQGLIVLTGSDAVSVAINAVIPIYQSSQTYFLNGRDIDLNFPSLLGIHTGIQTTIDSSHNNVISVFDSLTTAGYSRTNAVNYLYPNDNFNTESVSMSGSTYSLHVEPNGVVLVEFYMPEIVVANHENQNFSKLKIYPNPTTDWVYVDTQGQNLELIFICDVKGEFIETVAANSFSLKNYADGIYFLVIQTDKEMLFRKIIKN